MFDWSPLLCFLVLLPKLEGAGQTSTFDLLHKLLADELGKALFDVAAVLYGVVPEHGAQVSKDGVDGGSFAHLHLFDGSENHHTES